MRSIPGSSSPRRRKQARLIRTAREVNDEQARTSCCDRSASKAARFQHADDRLPRADLQGGRRRPAGVARRCDIVRSLRDADIGELLVCEPNLRHCAEFPLVGLREALRAADIVLLLVDHKEFRAIKPAQLQEKVLIDTRGVLR